MRKSFKVILCTLLISAISSCKQESSSGELCIVHFDQTILGDAQKDLGVSIGVRKDDSDLENSLNEALEALTSDQRNKMMEEAIDRSNSIYDTSTSRVYEVDVNASKTLRVGLECDYAPFNWTDTAANDYNYLIKGSDFYADGYDIQVARYLANYLSYSLEIVKLGWDALIPSLNQNQIDVVIAGMTDTEDRRQSISFTNEYYVSELVLIVRKDSQYASATSLEEFANARIVSQVSTVTDEVIEAWVNSYNVNHLSPLDTFATCAIAVSNKTADAMTAELPVANSIVNGSKA
ncbi:MAG: transporter substrate-binding domain-containing protein [Erysipelotrichaceae bacterium]|nr:transporter substrate-binding domain-containing protein [Erysipelotrichaceae bacterium]